MLAEIEEHLQKLFCCGITLKNEMWVRARPQCEHGGSCLPTAHLHKCLNWHKSIQMAKVRFSWSNQAGEWILDKILAYRGREWTPFNMSQFIV